MNILNNIEEIIRKNTNKKVLDFINKYDIIGLLQIYLIEKKNIFAFFQE